MKHQVSLEQIKSRICYNKKGHKFEFKIIPNQKTKLDITYYPLVTPRSIHDLTDDITSVIYSLVVKEVDKIPDVPTDPIDNIILDEICDNRNTISYRLYNKKNQPIGIIKSSVTDPDILDQIILHWQSKTITYQEV